MDYQPPAHEGRLRQALFLYGCLIVGIAMVGCGAEAPGEECGRRSFWRLATFSEVDPIETETAFRTSADGTFCYAESAKGALRSECLNIAGTIRGWDEQGSSLDESLIFPVEDGTVVRVVESSGAVSVRTEDDVDPIPNCTGLMGAFAVHDCVGVVLASCGADSGAWLSVRQAGTWQPPLRLPYSEADGERLAIAATGCASWRGVWGARRRTWPTTGPTTLSFDGRETVRLQLASDTLLGAPTIHGDGTVVAVRQFHERPSEVVVYDPRTHAASVVARASEFRISADTGSTYGAFVVASAASNTLAIVYAEVSLAGVESLTVAEYTSSGLRNLGDLLAPSDGSASPLRLIARNPSPWSVAIVDGRLVADLTLETIERRGHVRLVGRPSCDL